MLMRETECVNLLVSEGIFDMAFSVARAFEMKLDSIFDALTTSWLELRRTPCVASSLAPEQCYLEFVPSLSLTHGFLVIGTKGQTSRSSWRTRTATLAVKSRVICASRCSSAS